MTETPNSELGNRSGLAKRHFKNLVLGQIETNKKLREENLKVELESRTNLLTGLPNERALSEFLEGIEDAWQRSKKKPDEPIINGYAIAMDLTGLKRTNDTLGRPAGDLYLKAVAESIKSSLRKEDHAFRLGSESDEFTVFAPGLTEKDDVNALMDRIDNKLKEKELEVKNKYGGVNFSLSYAAVGYGEGIGPTDAHNESHTIMKNAKQQSEKLIGERGLTVGRTIL